MDLAPSAGLVIAYIAAGTTIGGVLVVPLVRYLAKGWQEEQRKFRDSTTTAITTINTSIENLVHTTLPVLEQKLGQAVSSAEDKALAHSESVRREGETARAVLATSMHEEQRVQRDRYHEMAEKVSLTIYKLEVAEDRVEKAFTSIGDMNNAIQTLNVTLATLNGELRAMREARGSA